MRLEVRVAREPGIERHEALRGVEQQRRRVAAAREGERDLGAEALRAGTVQRVQRGELGGREQRLGFLRCPRFQLGLRRGHRSRTASGGVRGQLGRSLQECRGGRDPAPRLGPVGGALELGRHALVEARRRVRSMPRSPIGIRLGIGRRSQRAMRLLSFVQRRRPVHRRAYEGMPEPHPRTQLDQPGALRRLGRVRPDAEVLGRAPEQRDVADGLGRRRQQQPLRLRLQRPEPSQEALLDADRQRTRRGHPEPAGELGRRQPARQLQQRQRVAARLGDDAVADALVDAPPDADREQPVRIVVADALHDQCGQAVELAGVAGIAHREHHRDPLREQAPRDERQRLRRRTIEPLRVVDQAHQRPLLGHSARRVSAASATRK